MNGGYIIIAKEMITIINQKPLLIKTILNTGNANLNPAPIFLKGIKQTAMVNKIAIIDSISNVFKSTSINILPT